MTKLWFMAITQPTQTGSELIDIRQKIAMLQECRLLDPGGGGVLSYKRLMWMCRWMGSHF